MSPTIAQDLGRVTDNDVAELRERLHSRRNTTDTSEAFLSGPRGHFMAAQKDIRSSPLITKRAKTRSSVSTLKPADETAANISQPHITESDSPTTPTTVQLPEDSPVETIFSNADSTTESLGVQSTPPSSLMSPTLSKFDSDERRCLAQGFSWLNLAGAGEPTISEHAPMDETALDLAKACNKVVPRGGEADIRVHISQENDEDCSSDDEEPIVESATVVRLQSIRSAPSNAPTPRPQAQPHARKPDALDMLNQRMSKTSPWEDEDEEENTQENFVFADTSGQVEDDEQETKEHSVSAATTPQIEEAYEVPESLSFLPFYRHKRLPVQSRISVRNNEQADEIIRRTGLHFIEMEISGCRTHEQKSRDAEWEHTRHSLIEAGEMLGNLVEDREPNSSVKVQNINYDINEDGEDDQEDDIILYVAVGDKWAPSEHRSLRPRMTATSPEVSAWASWCHWRERHDLYVDKIRGDYGTPLMGDVAGEQLRRCVVQNRAWAHVYPVHPGSGVRMPYGAIGHKIPGPEYIRRGYRERLIKKPSPLSQMHIADEVTTAVVEEQTVVGETQDLQPTASSQEEQSAMKTVTPWFPGLSGLPADSDDRTDTEPAVDNDAVAQSPPDVSPLSQNVDEQATSAQQDYESGGQLVDDDLLEDLYGPGGGEQQGAGQASPQDADITADPQPSKDAHAEGPSAQPDTPSVVCITAPTPSSEAAAPIAMAVEEAANSSQIPPGLTLLSAIKDLERAEDNAVAEQELGVDLQQDVLTLPEDRAADNSTVANDRIVEWLADLKELGFDSGYTTETSRRSSSESNRIESDWSSDFAEDDAELQEKLTAPTVFRTYGQAGTWNGRPVMMEDLPKHIEDLKDLHRLWMTIQYKQQEISRSLQTKQETKKSSCATGGEVIQQKPKGTAEETESAEREQVKHLLSAGDSVEDENDADEPVTKPSSDLFGGLTTAAKFVWRRAVDSAVLPY